MVEPDADLAHERPGNNPTKCYTALENSLPFYLLHVSLWSRMLQVRFTVDLCATDPNLGKLIEKRMWPVAGPFSN